MLEHVAVGLDRIPVHRSPVAAARATARGRPDARRRAPSSSRDAAPARQRQPRNVLAQVVEEQPRLPLERDEAGQALQLVGVELAVRGRDAEPDLRAGRLSASTSISSTANPSSLRRRSWLRIACRSPAGSAGSRCSSSPDRDVPLADRLGGVDRVVDVLRPALERGDVREAEADVLDEDLQVVRALAVGQRRGGSRSSRRRRETPGSGRRRAGTACSRASSRPRTRRRGAGRRAARPSRRAAGPVRPGPEREAREQPPELERVRAGTR